MGDKKAVVLVSGGLDSATVLAIAQNQGFSCHALTFDYGQRHRIELESAKRIVAHAKSIDVHRLVNLDVGWMGGSALTDNNLSVPQSGNVAGPDDTQEIPITYVPARNTIFLSIALGWAEVIGAHDIFIGANAVDYSGYPDCRPVFIEAFEALANIATRDGVQGNPFRFHAPLINMTKAEIITLGTSLGVDYSITLSCYDPDATGRACGVCDSCRLRAKGFADAGLPDLTAYR
ncbi:MAG: 7-cyano-7-deazaguanine synthase QueC [Gammaproteobacteria bacterium]|nr:7-cyano-7-deazaguanine synthase QueC [Gammaproteobacteria bacterium]